MKEIGFLRPLQHQLSQPITYYCLLNQTHIPLNPLLGNEIHFTFMGEKACCHCGRKIKKTYNSGYCYRCFKVLPENDLCIVKPNLCHFNQGTCRDDTFGKRYCMQKHYVYLALSSDVKVGITRKSNAFRRWMDQGAVSALPIAELPTRKAAGELEVYLSQYITDRTNWRKMLKNEVIPESLEEIRESLHEKIPEKFQPYLLTNEPVRQFTYPSLAVPDKIKSLNLDKEPNVTGSLLGIKAQYLILDTGVLNMRRHAGYKVTFTVSS